MCCIMELYEDFLGLISPGSALRVCGREQVLFSATQNENNVIDLTLMYGFYFCQKRGITFTENQFIHP